MNKVIVPLKAKHAKRSGPFNDYNRCSAALAFQEHFGDNTLSVGYHTLFDKDRWPIGRFLPGYSSFNYRDDKLKAENLDDEVIMRSFELYIYD